MTNWKLPYSGPEGCGYSFPYKKEKSEMDWEDFGCILLITIFFGMIVALFTLPLWVGYCMYHFNKSDCSVWVNNNMVYNGKCHFVDVEPIGEYGNSKRVAIYYDVKKWHQKQKYISENVEIKEYVR